MKNSGESEELTTRAIRADEAAACEALMRSLPKWFGIESSILEYRRDAEHMETYVLATEGRIVGFITLNQHNRFSAEIQVMAVARDRHRLGLGRALVEHAVAVLRERRVEYLQVKTLGPSHESAEYAMTRAFYTAMGFRPLEETALWGEGNPCLIMVRHLVCPGSGPVQGA